MPIALPFSSELSQSSTRSFASSVLTAQFDDGYEAVIPSGINTYRETWNLVYLPLEEADAATLKAAFKQAGSWDIVTWTPEGETPKKYRVVAGSLSESNEADLYYFTVQIRQVF